VDTLDLAGYVDWGGAWSTLKKKLDDGKWRAQQCDKPVVLQDSSCGPCLILPGGKPPMYRYHLQTLLHHVYVGISSKGEPGKTPNVYVSILSRTLWERGVSKAVALVKQLIESDLGGSVVALVPSRVDLCADFLMPGGLPLGLLRDFGVPEDIMTCDIMQGAEMETYYIGSPGASIRARVYNKSKEVVKHFKEWFKEIWKVDSLENVFRVEFQLRRQAVKAYGVNSVDELLKGLGGMWVDLSTRWYCLRLHDDSNTSRRSFHPFWLLVQACAEKFGPVVEMRRVLKPSGKADPEFFIVRGATQLLGFAAASGLPDLYEACSEFVDAIRLRWTPEDFFEAYTVKSVENGVQPAPEEGDDEIPF
jgi:hypothetical protein